MEWLQIWLPEMGWLSPFSIQFKNSEQCVFQKALLQWYEWHTDRVQVEVQLCLPLNERRDFGRFWCELCNKIAVDISEDFLIYYKASFWTR